MKRRLFIEGRWEEGASEAIVRNPFTGDEVARVAQADATQVERALAAAWDARRAGRSLSTGERRDFLLGLARGVEERKEDLAQAMRAEAGKPIRMARQEVERALGTLRLAAAELSRFGGELVPVDLDDATRGYRALARRVPLGVVVAISPFNFPLNLGVHKVAPALAVGAPVIWKPPPQAPSAACIFAEIAAELSIPRGLFQVLPCANEEAERLATDPRVAVLSFTGSVGVGWSLKAKAHRAKVTLELGGNAAAIVCADAELERVAQRCALGAMAYAGQVCISVQRLFVERSVYEPFREALVTAVRDLRVDDPADEATWIGPIIDDRQADRIEAWIDEARQRGAVVHGGGRSGRLLQPAVLEKVPADAQIAKEEAFGPVLLLQPFDDFDEALTRVNDSRYGLQAGLFTDSLSRVRRAFDELEVGGLIVGDYPTFRQDVMPYGGSKDSGLGREGPRYAMEDYTEWRVLVTA